MSGQADELADEIRRAALSEVSEPGRIHRVGQAEYAVEAGPSVDAAFVVHRASGGRRFVVDINVTVVEVDPTTCGATPDPTGGARRPGPCIRSAGHRVSSTESHRDARGTAWFHELPDGTFA